MSNAPRRDPAPSRLSYRLQRLALTPSVRRAFVFGLPLSSIALVIGLSFSDVERREAMATWWQEVKSEIQQRDEFMVKLLAVDGATPKIEAEIRELLPLKLPTSSFDLDLPALQARVAALDAVERADLVIKSGGVLHLQVAERVPAIVWRHSGGLDLLDDQGRKTAALTRRLDRGDLPLVSGRGADKVVPEALALIAAAAPLEDRMRGLVRMGERRWTIVLDRDQRLLLPEREPVAALEQILALDEAQDLLARDVTLVDFRDSERPTARLAEESARTLRQTMMTELGDD
ncbi:cell division protein FtsQ/DivIB [Palleronia sp. LCG004]|uniref:cell division protein FtsQ/DivIB n=1 Tax=Palleronia sp. LCG004 TaxID=3079304 RepID=UPI002942DD83|nr:cell division protein FtsQ/DivIB [Palleronia sp. LCG004]WOI57605.1 cell division protein FtsQ/DivIB [Palleronia sp. LCG004]